jgi:glycosidase
MMVMLLPGTAITYYGEEIGMEDTFITWEQTQDPAGCNFGEEAYQNYSRDPERTPMQWSSESNAGFSTGESTWLPVNENYPTLNVEVQQAAEASHLTVYKTLVQLREEEVLQIGSFIIPEEVNNDDLLTFVRMSETDPDAIGYAVLVNFSGADSEVDLSQLPYLSVYCVVLTRTSTSDNSATIPGYVHHQLNL